MATVIRFIASDVDGTLLHRSPASDSSVPPLDRGSWLDPRVAFEIGRLRKSGIPFGFVTSRRLATVSIVAAAVPVDFVIFEDGAAILGADGKLDRGWLKSFERELGEVDDLIVGQRGGDLESFHRSLLSRMNENSPWAIEDSGFVATFKITAKDSRISSRESLARAIKAEGIEMPASLRLSWNSKLSSAVVIPTAAGKRAALAALAARQGVRQEETAALGDDSNDEEMLAWAGLPLTLASAAEPIRALVAARGGFVAAAGGHEGTLEMLRCLALPGGRDGEPTGLSL